MPPTRSPRLKITSFAMSLICVLLGITSSSAEPLPANQKEGWIVIVWQLKTVGIGWNEVLRDGPYKTEDEAYASFEELREQFQTKDGYAVEVTWGLAQKPDADSRTVDDANATSFKPFQLKIPELIIPEQKEASSGTITPEKVNSPTSKIAGRSDSGNSQSNATPDKLKKNFVMWLEEYKGKKTWTEVPDRRFEYAGMTVADFKKKVDTYERAVSSSNKQWARQKSETGPQKAEANIGSHYRVRWGTYPNYDYRLTNGQWRPKGETRTFNAQFSSARGNFYYDELRLDYADGPVYDGYIYLKDSTRSSGTSTVTEDGKLIFSAPNRKLTLFRRDKNSSLIAIEEIDGRQVRREYELIGSN